MSRLTDKEKEVLIQPWTSSPRDEFCQKPDLAYRSKYIQFATDASTFCKIEKAVTFKGKHWKL